jgi:hypothetical protein
MSVAIAAKDTDAFDRICWDPSTFQAVCCLADMDSDGNNYALCYLWLIDRLLSMLVPF